MMANDDLLEMYRRHGQAEQKYTYFLLAIAASAIAFAVSKTGDMAIKWSLFPLGTAVFLWGMSFYFGIKTLTWTQAALYANYNLLQVRKGVHPYIPDHPSLQQVAIDGIGGAIEKNIDKATFYAQGQFGLLIAGGIFYLIWHILEMALRT